MNVGLYLPEVPGSLHALDSWKERLGARLRVVSIFQAWGGSHGAFNPDGLDAIRSRRATPMITWEPWRTPRPGQAPDVAQADYALMSIIEGRHDAYVTAWADACRAYGEPLLLRPMHEMNGDWYPWCGTVNGNSPARYVRAWRHLHDVFQQRGARNVEWVWSPYVRSYREERDNAMEAYFPGDDVVHQVGLDGYNWGTRGGEHTWTTFAELFGPAYDRVVALSERPVCIAEVGCAEEGGDKAAWIVDMFATLAARCPRVESVSWFQADKERDWRLDSSPAAMSAFLRVLDATTLANA